MKQKNVLRSLLIAFSTFITFAILIYIIKPQNLRDSILNLSLGWTALFFVVFVFVYALRSYRWKLLLKSEITDISYMIAYRTMHISRFINSVTPARMGEVARLYSLKKEKNLPVGETIGKITVENILDIMILLIFSVLSMMLVLRTQSIPTISFYITIIAFVVVTIIALGTFLLFYRGNRLITIIARISKKLAAKLSVVHKTFQQGLSDLKTHDKRVGATVALTFVMWFCELLLVYVISRAMSLDIPFWICIYAGSIAILSLTIPLLPGGFGSYEVAMASLLVISGISLESALTLAFIDHALRMFYLLCLGPPFMIKTGVNISNIKKESYSIEKELSPP